MNKIKRYSALISQSFSAKRRKKVAILLTEWVLGLKRFFVTSHQVGSDGPGFEHLDTWQFSELRKVETAFYKANTSTNTANRLTDDGLVAFEHEYQVHRLKGAISYTNDATHRSIYTREGERMDEVSSTWNGVRVSPRLRLPVSRTVSGVTANLYGNMGVVDGNYFHWFVDALSRLFIIKRFYSLGSIDQVLVPPLRHDFHWDSLAALGFGRDRIVELPALECIQFETLLASDAPRGSGSDLIPGWIVNSYEHSIKGMAKNVKSVAGNLVYVSRRDAPARMFLNEEDVCSFLEQRGFDIVELSPLDLPNKIAVFRDADVVVSQTGAGLTNLVFCRENVTVLELVDERFIYLPYASIAWFKSANYHAHIFSDENVLSNTNAMVSKSFLDINSLDKALEKIGV